MMFMNRNHYNRTLQVQGIEIVVKELIMIMYVREMIKERRILL